MISKLFQSDEYLAVAKRTQDFLNAQKDFLSANTVKSTRAVGDALQDILAENFGTLLGKHCAEYSSDFARRAMADLAFKDLDSNYCVVDVKTHREDTKFNMPNLTSVERLARFYEDDSNFFVMLMIRYQAEKTRVNVNHIDFVPIEFLDWNCLTIGALGWGQIQIANSNRIELNPKNTRKEWMLELCDTLLEFYPKEIGKIQDRISYFEKVKLRWKKR
ncbi:hypothetical protein FACS189419_00900 [Planctomycetales bacterium]|nr:hypothetical protein FACS189419_00900 [Planctomycetales bacterium]